MDRYGKIEKISDEVGSAIARAEAAEASLTVEKMESAAALDALRRAHERIAELESRLSALQWRPIAEYDAMTDTPDNYVFAYLAGNGLRHFNDYRSCNEWGHDTHFLQLPPVPGE